MIKKEQDKQKFTKVIVISIEIQLHIFLLSVYIYIFFNLKYTSTKIYLDSQTHKKKESTINYDNKQSFTFKLKIINCSKTYENIIFSNKINEPSSLLP